MLGGAARLACRHLDLKSTCHFWCCFSTADGTFCYRFSTVDGGLECCFDVEKNVNRNLTLFFVTFPTFLDR
jgi:hypothetical protein